MQSDRELSDSLAGMMTPNPTIKRTTQKRASARFCAAAHRERST